MKFIFLIEINKMTYLRWYGEFSQKIPNKHTVDCLDLMKEAILYIEKEKYELWYCIHNEEIGKEIMSIDKDYMDHYDFSFKEYAIFKIWSIQTILDPLIEFLDAFDYVSKEELITFLQDTLAIEWWVKTAEILTANKALELIAEDIANGVDETENEAWEERSLEDILAEIEDPEKLEEQKQIDELLNKLEKDPLPPVVYEAEMPAAYVNTLLRAANGIYKVFTEMVYSQKRYKEFVPAYTVFMQKQIKSYHPSSTTAYLDWIISQNFTNHRKWELIKELELQTDAHHNNYHNVKMDILYNIFRTKYSLETDSLPIEELRVSGSVSFNNYEKKLNDTNREFRKKQHAEAGQRIANQFGIIPLDEKIMQPIINHYADTADEKIRNKTEE